MPGSTPSRSSRNCYVSLIPMSERQQLKLVRQLETSDNRGGNSGSLKDSGSHRPRSRSCNGRGETPLHKAAIKGDEELVVKLLEEGADPNTPDFAGWTPLHEACNHGWYGVALALLQAGASVNARGFDDDTPLHDAAINGHSKLVRLLVESGADVYSRNKGGKTPCDVAAPGLMPHLLKCQTLEDSELGSKKSDVSGGSTEADDTAISEMRRTPPQTKVDKSPRVTLRLHQIKKKSGKISSEGTTYNSGRLQFSVNMEEKGSKEDVYEFKSSKEATPVRGNSTSPDVDKNNAENKTEKTTDSFPGTEAESTSLKRNISEVTDGEENDEDSKKKKRKEGDREGKDAGVSSKAVSSAGRMTAVRNINNNSEKSGKVGSHLVNKGSNVSTPKTANTGNATAVSTDRKSPSSPKGNGAPASSNAPSSSNNGGAKAEAEQEEKTNADGDKVDPGPKVPPLKIVIPQQSGAEPEQGNRNGKNSASRHHQALPYVVSSNSNDSEKDTPRSRSVSPTDSVKSDEKKEGMLSAEDQKGSLHHQRVLRSAHRSGPGGNGESRSSENPPTPRNNTNGNNVQAANTNSGSTVTVTTSSTSSASGVATTTTTTTAAITSSDNPSPTAQNQTSPSPAAEGHSAANSAVATTSSESSSTSSTGSYSGNFRSTVATTKPTTTVSSSSVTTTGNEEKVTEASAESAPAQQTTQTSAAVELHPRKRKLKHNKEVKEPPPGQVVSERCESTGASTEVHPHEQPVKNCYQLFLDIRKQIDRRRKGLFPVQPKPPQGFKDYLMNRCTYVLAGNASTRQIPSSPMPQNVPQPIKELFAEQEKERHRLRLQHVIEKEKLVLSVEQEILRVHGRAARALANQSLPFSACTILKDEEVYNLITPEQEEKDRNARSRYNGRLFLSWLQDVDDKWEKIKEAMLLRHHNEAESLHAVQKMDWEWKMKELGLCEFKSRPVILDSHVPMVHVSDDFDLLPA